jgi:hypothetical protein
MHIAAAAQTSPQARNARSFRNSFKRTTIRHGRAVMLSHLPILEFIKRESLSRYYLLRGRQTITNPETLAKRMVYLLDTFNMDIQE